MKFDDDRESPSYVLMDLIKEKGGEVSYYDPYVPVVRPTREHPHWEGVRSIEWDKKQIEQFDAVIVSTAHAKIDFKAISDWSKIVIDTRRVVPRNSNVASA